MNKILFIISFVFCMSMIYYDNYQIGHNKSLSVDLPISIDGGEVHNNVKVYNQPSGRWVWAKVTAYTPWDEIDANSGYQDGYTAIMVDTQSGNPNEMYGIAADPRAIPYGTRVYVPEYWESLQNNKNSIPTRIIVDDTGGAMRQSWDHGELHIDVRYRTKDAARKWGVKHMKIFIYE